MDFKYCCTWNTIKLEQSLIWFGDRPSVSRIYFFFVSPVCLTVESAVLKLHPSAMDEKSSGWLCLCVYACCYERSERSSAVYKVHGLDENTDESNMKSCRTQDQSQAWSDDCFSQQGGKVRRKGDERWREEKEKSLQLLCYASVCHSPPPLPRGHEWSEWMMDPAHKNAPLLLRPSSPFTGMSEASTPTTTTTTAT